MTPWYIIAAAFVLDSLLGDPPCVFHPVRIIGFAASKIESFSRNHFGATIGAGLFGWTMVAGGAAFAGFALPLLGETIASAICSAFGTDPSAATKVTGWLIRILLIYSAMAPRDMAAHALRVAAALASPEKNDTSRLDSGRRSVSMIVGRDVERLDEAGVIRATVESVAESTIDGVIAPLLWAIVAGAPGALAYRAINTLDSMWGHKDERYLLFGRIAARADDAANWIPARLGFVAGAIACVPLSAAAPRRFDALKALSLGWRDRRKHASPNSGWMEALAAGALGLRLAGPAWYGGALTEKAWLGEDKRRPEISDIGRSVLLMYATTFVFLGLAALIAHLAAQLASFLFLP